MHLALPFPCTRPYLWHRGSGYTCLWKLYPSPNTAPRQTNKAWGRRGGWSRARGRPWEVHASQGLKVGLYTPTILGGNSYLSWFHDRGAIIDPAHTGTSKGLSQAINRGPIRKFLPKYANVYVAIQSHGLNAREWPHYVTANGVRNRLGEGRL